MFIQTESTPNPATLKFLPGQTVLELGTADFPNAEAATKSPLAKRIFAVEGVTGVFFGMDFVTVTKAEGVDWQHIKPAILGAVMEHYQHFQIYQLIQFTNVSLQTTTLQMEIHQIQEIHQEEEQIQVTTIQATPHLLQL